jgi:hypothetical protein
MLYQMPHARALWMLLVLAMACTRNVPASAPPPGGASQKLETASSGHLLVSAELDGRPYVLVLDTGANITSLSTRAARELRIETTGSLEINNTMVAPTGTVRRLTISGVDHENLPIAIVDIPDALASGADGILGLDVLARHDIVVDFPAAEFGVYPAGTLASSRQELVPLDYSSSGLILLEVVLDDRTRLPAMLDLGAPVSVLNRPAGALIGARGITTRIAARTGDVELEPVRALVRDSERSRGSGSPPTGDRAGYRCLRIGCHDPYEDRSRSSRPERPHPSTDDRFRRDEPDPFRQSPDELADPTLRGTYRLSERSRSRFPMAMSPRSTTRRSCLAARAFRASAVRCRRQDQLDTEVQRRAATDCTRARRDPGSSPRTSSARSTRCYRRASIPRRSSPTCWSIARAALPHKDTLATPTSSVRWYRLADRARRR